MSGTVLEKIRKELHVSNCGFNYTKPDKFVRSQVCILLNSTVTFVNLLFFFHLVATTNQKCFLPSLEDRNRNFFRSCSYWINGRTRWFSILLYLPDELGHPTMYDHQCLRRGFSYLLVFSFELCRYIFT